MRSHGHKAIADPLRSAIWTWIDHFPDEFNDVVTFRTKMDGASGVFDFLYNKSSGAERILWPTLAALQCIIPERTTELNVGSRGNQKLAKFTEDVMRQTNPTSKLWLVSLACGTDICRAAMNVKPTGYDIPLQMLAYDVAHELKVC